MHSPRFLLAVAASVSALQGMPAARASELATGRGAGRPEPPMLGVHWARGAAHAGGASSPDMTWHGGAVMTSTVAQAIFWGTSWPGDTDKIPGMDAFYGQVGSSSYLATTTEYSGSNGNVGIGVSYLGHLVDASAAPSNAPRASTILAEVCKEITSPVPNGYYPVYVDQPRNHAGYCAWHSYASCGGVPVQFAFFFKLDGDAGCDPLDTSGLHTEGLAALANVSGHELSETITDPRGGGWYDASGQENADKCAWSFGTALLSFPGGGQWKIQGNWSNRAYDGSTGYANLAGQLGCLDGGSYK